MPAMLWHEGVWSGVYRHIAEDNTLLDEHRSLVSCVFPDDGDIAYTQHSDFTWADGTTRQQTFNGYMKNDRLWFDTETFAGWAWETGNGIIMLSLDRKDYPGQRFVETILSSTNRERRVRTWHWFEDGICFKRTLCAEQRVE